MKFLSRVLLWLATIWSAVWFGGQVFNALMVVPHFSAHPPDSLVAWGEMRFDNLADFFVIFAPIWTFVALLIAAVVGKHHPARRWIIFSAACALISLMTLLGWMVPTISRLVQPDHGGLDSATVATQLHQWTMANWIRIGIDFLTFIAATRALTSSPRVIQGPLAMSETRLPPGEKEL
jgi:Domain of unknown function (DUF1772)